ncbi:MAG: DUF1461 domain-containing protein [Gordonibacter sp.]|nr:DUF1461 domain-containing protein [Gordonibacter sp.]
MGNTDKRGGALGSIVSLIATIALAITLVAAGLAVCCLPQTTGALSGAFSGIDNPDTPFSRDELVRAAVSTRDYTVGTNDRAAIMGVITAINRDANTPYGDEATLASAPEEFTLNGEALSHLDDVHTVVSTATIALGIITLVALLSCIFLGLKRGKRRVGSVLLWSGISVIAVFAALAAWVLIDFDGFFAAFHSLFFASGTWTFSYTSLLITMYPTAFWMGMGAVWLATTGLLSILAIVVGALLRRRSA